MDNNIINNSQIDKEKIKKTWKKILDENGYKKIIDKIKDTNFLPEKENILKTFEYFEINETKVVLLGQDPYIRKEQAIGLSFSVPKNVDIPPSLNNIFIELKNDLNIENTNGDLTRWVKQENILLLNSALTVEVGKSGSHLEYWEKLTDNIIKNISEECKFVIFILLGNYAKSKKKYIDIKKHSIIEAGHPSPLSYKLFIGSKIFSKTNEILKEKKIKEVDWKN